MRKGKWKSHPGNGLLAGSISALAVSVFTIQSFKPGLLGPPWLIAWCVASMLCGGGAGFVGGMLANLIPVRLTPAVSYIVGALFGLFGYYLQLSLFLLYMFRNYPDSF